MHYACAGVFELTGKNRYLKEFDKKNIKYLSPIKRERENSGRCHLDAGKTYVIVPSTEIRGKTGEVYISIYVDQPLRDVEIKRVFHPNDASKATE